VAGAALGIVGIFLLAGVGGFAGTTVVNGLPDLPESAEDGLSRLQEVIRMVRPHAELNGVSGILEQVGDNLPLEGELPGRVRSATFTAFHFVAGIMLTINTLFFYLRNGPEMARSLASLEPARDRDRVFSKAEASWGSPRAHFRVQLLVALVGVLAVPVATVARGLLEPEKAPTS